MTNQEAFDIVYLALVKQGEPSVGTFGVTEHGCVYRGPRGLKCAAGHLIPDDKYNERMEGSGVMALQAALPEGVNIHLIDALQAAHDRAPRTTNEEWLAAFKVSAEVTAAKWGLTVPQVPAT